VRVNLSRPRRRCTPTRIVPTSHPLTDAKFLRHTTDYCAGRHRSSPIADRCTQRININLPLPPSNIWVLNFCSLPHTILRLHTPQSNQPHPVPTYSHTVRLPPLRWLRFIVRVCSWGLDLQFYSTVPPLQKKPSHPSRPGGTWFFRYYTRQPYHLDRTPLQTLVYPPATHTPHRIRDLVDNMAIAAAQTLAKWLVIHGTTTALPRASLCIAGASLIFNIQRERAQGAVSRRHKLALGLFILMAHVAVGESVKTCATLPLHEVESRAQKTILDCFLAYPRKHSKQTHGHESEDAASAPSQLFPALTTRGI
jgi:hypothetical protein